MARQPKDPGFTGPLWAYLDESGLQANPTYCVLAGYIATSRQWTDCRSQWSQVLRDWNVPDLHARTFFTKTKRGYYSGWTSGQSSQFIQELADVVRSHLLVPIGIAVDVAAFDSFTLGERRLLTGGLWLHTTNRFDTQGKPNHPYFCAFMGLLQMALHWTPPQARINIVLDEQNNMEPRAIQTHTEILAVAGRNEYITLPKAGRLGSIKYVNAKQEIALQAADLLAHLWYSYLTHGDQMSSARFQAMTALTAIMDTMPVRDLNSLQSDLNTQFPPEVLAKIRVAN